MITIEQIADEVFDDLETELKNDVDYDSNILEIKIKNAIREIRAKRDYPSNYSDTQIANDLYKLYPYIVNLARYDYNQIGAEGEEQHSEDDIKRQWVKRDEMFRGIHAFVKVL